MRNPLVYIMPFLIVIGGIGLTTYLASLSKSPEKQDVVVVGALVEVEAARHGDRQVLVRAFGAVQPAQEIALTPQVTGCAVWISDNFVAGGFCKKGEPLIRIDPADFELQIEQSKAGVAKAEYDLSMIEAQAKVARDEWDKLQRSGAELPSEFQLADTRPEPLAFYEPQLKNAEAALKAAQAMQKQMELNLERTVLHAPFDCRVRSERADVGQLLRSGESVGTLFATDRVEVLVRLPIAELAWIDVPAQNAEATEGARAKVTLQMGETRHEWDAVAVRSLGEVEASGRMVGVVFSVMNPFSAKAGGPQLRVQDYVEVEIEGGVAKNVVTIPRAALRRDNQVWIEVDGALRIRNVEVLRLSADEVFVSKGLDDGDRLIMTGLSAVVEGMPVRVIDTEHAGAVGEGGGE